MRTRTIATAMALLALFSCERISIDSAIGEEPAETGARNSLGVKTRGIVTYGDDGSGTAEKVSYPVYIYAFDRKSQCVDLRVITGASEPVELSLIRGTYKLCALGTDEGDRYGIPSTKTSSPEYEVKLKSGYEHGDLMSAVADVVVEDGESNTVTLQMDRKVLRIDGISLRNIPDDATKVSVTISPLGEALRLNGELGGKNGNKTVYLSREGDTGTWSSEESVYLLASGSKATVKVSLTYSGDRKAEAYTYTSDETLEKNYIVNISGVFKAREFILSGTIRGVDWAGTKDISFLMDQTSGGTQPIPAVGSIYKGCYVLSHTADGQNSTAVTLMSLDEKAGLVFDDDENQASLSAAIENGLAELSRSVPQGGVTFRMPTLEERYWLSDNIEDVNRNLERHGATPIALNQVNEDNSPKDKVGYYMRRTSNKKVTIYFVKSRKTDSADNVIYSESKDYRLRGFATVTF